MIFLGIDSSNTAATVAVATENKIVSEIIVDNKLTHSIKLMPIVERVLEEAEIKASDIDVFAVSTGPGSFTGLRIGVATAKALAYAVDKKIVGVSSLEVLANNLNYFDGIVIPIMDARNKRVFSGIYSNGKAVVEDSAFELDELLELADKYSEKLIFVGNGVNEYRDIILEKLGDRAQFASIKDNFSRASSVCELAIKKAEKSEFDSVSDLTPNYLRDSQAERQKKEK